MSERPKALAAETMCEAFQVTAEEWADSPALRFKDSDYEASLGEYAETVRKRAAGLAALGVKRGDTVGFMLVNRPALHLTDCRRDAPGSNLLLRLQHLLARADRVRGRGTRGTG